MGWDDLLPLGMPILGIVAAGSMAGFGRMPGARRWFGREHMPAIPAVEELPRGLSRASSGEIVIAPNWFDRPALIGKLFGLTGWLMSAFCLMLITNLALIADQSEQSRRLIASMMAKMLCIGLIPLALAYTKRLLAEWLECLLHFVQLGRLEILQWFASQTRNVFDTRSNLAIGAVGGIFVLWFERMDEAFVQVSILYWAVVVLASFVMTTLAGFGLVVMVKVAMLVGRVGRLPIYISTSPYGVLSTGTVLVRGFAVATAVYIVALLTMVLRTRHPNWLILSWAVAIAALYVVLFLLPQLNIHRQMVAVKRRALLSIETQLQRHLEVFDANPNKAMGDVNEALRKRRADIEALPEWPFNWRNFGSVLGLAASSTLPVVAKALFSAFTVPASLTMALRAFRAWFGPVQASLP